MNYILLIVTIFASVSGVDLPTYLTDASIPSKYKYFQGRHSIADVNYSQIINGIGKEGMAIIFTLKSCLSCHSNEPNIKLIIEHLQSHKIKTYRCELQSNPQMQKRFKIVRFPYLVLLKKDKERLKQYRYRGLLLPNRVSLFMDTIEKGIIEVNNNVTVDHIIDMIYQRDNRPESLVMLVCGLGQKCKSHTAIIKNIALDSPNYQTRYILIDDSNITLSLKQQYPEWFGQNLCTMLYFRFTTRSDYHMSVECDNTAVDKFDKAVRETMLYGVQQLTQDLYTLASATGHPIFVCIIDSAYRVEESQRILNILENVLQQFREQIYLFWVEGSVNPDKKKLLGISVDTLPPTLALLDFSAAKLQNIFKGHFVKQQISIFIEGVIHSDKIQQEIGKKLKELLKNTKNTKILQTQQLQLKDLVASKTIKSINKQINTLIICRNSITTLQSIIHTSHRLFRMLYKSFEIVVAVNQFTFQGVIYQQGTYFWHALDRKLVTLNKDGFKRLKCSQLISNLSQWIEFPPYPCIDQRHLHEYLLTKSNDIQL